MCIVQLECTCEPPNVLANFAISAKTTPRNHLFGWANNATVVVNGGNDKNNKKKTETMFVWSTFQCCNSSAWCVQHGTSSEKSPPNRNNNMAFLFIHSSSEMSWWQFLMPAAIARCFRWFVRTIYPVPMMSLVFTIIIFIIVNIIVESIRPKWLYATECATHDRPACCCHIQLNADCLVWHDASALTVFDSTIKTSL